MRLEGSQQGHSNAKRLRKQITPPQIALWLALRANEEGLRFRKQHAADPYVLDVYCAPGPRRQRGEYTCSVRAKLKRRQIALKPGPRRAGRGKFVKHLEQVYRMSRVL